MSERSAHMILIGTCLAAALLAGLHIAPRAAALTQRYAAVRGSGMDAVVEGRELRLLDNRLHAAREQLEARTAQGGRVDPLDLLSEAARETGLRLRSLVPRAPKGRGAVAIYPLECEVSGSFHALGAFLARIERSLPAVRVAHLEVQARSPDAEPEVSLLLQVVTYAEEGLAP